jgi:hypothetical protein
MEWADNIQLPRYRSRRGWGRRREEMKAGKLQARVQGEVRALWLKHEMVYVKKKLENVG